MTFAYTLRVVVGTLCLISLYLIARSWWIERENLNPKTRDYYYGRFMWTFVGFSACVEGVIRNRPLSVTLILILFAALATLKAVLSKGSWGTDGKLSEHHRHD